MKSAMKKGQLGKYNFFPIYYFIRFYIFSTQIVIKFTKKIATYIHFRFEHQKSVENSYGNISFVIFNNF